ncbi:hypothetical protein NDN08_000835 [Rhodosorus marinus]|uniref:A-kinase anchor protein 7-like phosphoesterase domain-containing protein n=1 Tax=Rhodosorus marinus TaxID=101924 RepID=A0AAV8UQN5_9RHOD|nr:hypothetical protein NDN08_000835 [Rhodosorus marinus]
MADSDVELKKIGSRTFRIHRTWADREAISRRSVGGRTEGSLDIFETVVELDTEILSEDLLKKLEESTATRIEARRGSVTISGSSGEAVEGAREEIRRLADEKRTGRKASPYTHFVVIPMTTGSIQVKGAEIQQQILDDSLDSVNERCLENPERFRCVLCMLRLQSQSDLMTAKLALRKVSREMKEVVRGRGLRLKVGGLEVLPEGKPRQATSLYCVLKEVQTQTQETLLNISKILYMSLQDAGILTEEDMRRQKILVDSEIRPLFCMTLLTARSAGVQNLNLSLVVDRMRFREVGEVLVEEIRLARLDQIDESGFFRSELSMPLSFSNILEPEQPMAFPIIRMSSQSSSLCGWKSSSRGVMNLCQRDLGQVGFSPLRSRHFEKHLLLSNQKSEALRSFAYVNASNRPTN